MKTNDRILDYKNITVFEGLNSLRFIAAFLVVLHHSETIKKKYEIDNFEWLGIFRSGGYAVTFFFVLSGFLITYLLLKERDKTGTIKIKNFYLKRVLRIWPLYFLLICIGTIVLPYLFSVFHIDYEMPYNLGQTWYYFLFFLPGLVTFYFGHHFLEPLWSIGVEEVFYLIWAPIFKFFKNHVLVILVSVILIKSILYLIGLIIDNELYRFIISTYKFESMAVGGIGAYFIYTKGRIVTKSFIFRTAIQVIVFSLIAVFLFFHTKINLIVNIFIFCLLSLSC